MVSLGHPAWIFYRLAYFTDVSRQIEEYAGALHWEKARECKGRKKSEFFQAMSELIRP